MSSFEDRLRSAVSRFSHKTAAGEGARKARREQQEQFLVGFWDVVHNVIQPVMLRAKGTLSPMVREYKPDEEPLDVCTEVMWTEEDDNISFLITPGHVKSAVLVFRADPLKMRIRVLAAAVERRDSSATTRIEEAQRGDSRHEIAACKLEELTAQRVENHVATFVEQNVAGPF